MCSNTAAGNSASMKVRKFSSYCAVDFGGCCLGCREIVLCYTVEKETAVSVFSA